MRHSDEVAPVWDDCVIIPGRMPPREIGFVNCLLDDLDGMVVVRTENPSEGRMEFWVAPDMVDEFRSFIEYCSSGLGIEVTLGDPIPESTEVVEFREKRRAVERPDGGTP